MKITWFGTASLAVETERGRLLIDPFFPFHGSPTRVPPNAYAGYGTILVTHGHFDHIMSLPGLAAGGARRVYATRTPLKTLRRLGVAEGQLNRIAPGETLSLEGMRVSVYQSRHVRYDGPVLRKTLINPRMLRHARNLPRAIYGFLAYPEGGETVGFLIEGEGKRLFAMGSLNLDDQTDYPTGMDLLALPYQGTSDLLTPALAIIDRLRPKAVLLDHCDDAFPPISSAIDTTDIESRFAGTLPVYRLQPGESMGI
ncbi:MAG: MBL fold metallo-hydrolase [Clostridia bacterium]|nr:MBL fold metallo-hydrolase [Clostridia bacterium]